MWVDCTVRSGSHTVTTHWSCGIFQGNIETVKTPAEQTNISICVLVRRTQEKKWGGGGEEKWGGGLNTQAPLDAPD